VNLRSSLGTVRRQVLQAVCRRTVCLGDTGPLVSFTFDDFPRSAALAGAAILERHGARGTYYAAMGLMNTVNELGEHFCAADLTGLRCRGHEAASHTFSHSSSRATALSDFRGDVEKGRNAVAACAAADTGNFAYPFGHATLRAKQSLGPRLRSSRGAVPGLNGPDADLNLLRANRLYGGLSPATEAGVEDLICENAAQKTWLIFYTHDVRSNPSPYGCTPELLEFALALAVRSGSHVLTVEKALARIETGKSDGDMEPAPAGALADSR
jgi:peptidoglycan/xylan/chitin deacetylase (PgdA/CDA1 family)